MSDVSGVLQDGCQRAAAAWQNRRGFMKIPLVTIVSLAIAATVGIAQGTGSAGQSRPASPMNDVAERYVKLVLALGQHDADYVDAYYGPPEWKQQAESRKAPLTELAAQAKALARRGRRRARSLRLRWSGCAATTCSGSSPRSRPASGCSTGERLSFDEESRALYDAVAPTLPESHFQKILDQLDKRFPGRRTAASPATTRSAARFVIPREKLDAVFQAAIKGCRERTLAARDSSRTPNASRSNTSPTSRGAATTGIRATSAA